MTTSDSSSDSLGQLFLIRDSSPRIQGVIKDSSKDGTKEASSLSM